MRGQVEFGTPNTDRRCWARDLQSEATRFTVCAVDLRLEHKLHLDSNVLIELKAHLLYPCPESTQRYEIIFYFNPLGREISILAGSSVHPAGGAVNLCWQGGVMIRKLKSGEYRLYSRKKDAKTGKRRNLGTFSTLGKAKQHERAVQYFKRAG